MSHEHRPPLSPRDAALLDEAANGDQSLRDRLEERVRQGEPAPYVAGFLRFRQRRFTIDRRAYITDAELSWLVDVVNREGAILTCAAVRPLHVLEFGVGAGTLAISVKLENPDWNVTGLDVDDEALAVARANSEQHAAKVRLLESDFLAGWPVGEPAPDLIFGDPPWGGADDLYADDRDASYYQHMPARSAFPPGPNRCGLHDELIAHVKRLGWKSLLVLNYGVLPAEIVEGSARRLARFRLEHPRRGLTVLIGRAV